MDLGAEPPRINMLIVVECLPHPHPPGNTLDKALYQFCKRETSGTHVSLTRVREKERVKTKRGILITQQACLINYHSKKKRKGDKKGIFFVTDIKIYIPVSAQDIQ